MTTIEINDLAKFNLLFGHLNINDRFELNNENYQKIGLYVGSSGKKINSVKLSDCNYYFSYDDMEKLKNTKFLYIEDNTFIGIRNYTNLGKTPKFKENLPLTLPGYYIDNPLMLEVMDCIFQNTPLSTLLKEVMEKYDDYLFNINEYAPLPPNYTIEEINQKIIEKNIQEHHNKIMIEIDKEVNRYRQELIKKHLG